MDTKEEMLKIKFPGPFGQYYNKHVKYIYNIMSLSGLCNIEFYQPENLEPSVFYVIIDGKKVLFDMSDYPKIYDVDEPILKRTCLEQTATVYPMGPFVVFDHSTPNHYKELLNYSYTPEKKTTKFHYNQRNIGNALQRRNKMYETLGLKNRYRKENQTNYWKKSLDSSYNPMLPGANLVVLDRSVCEIMYLGATVMHPKIEVLFPYNKKLVPGEHYIEIQHDCSDVLDKMDGTDCGAAAKEFMQCIRPENMVKWWLEVI